MQLPGKSRASLKRQATKCFTIIDLAIISSPRRGWRTCSSCPFTFSSRSGVKFLREQRLQLLSLPSVIAGLYIVIKMTCSCSPKHLSLYKPSDLFFFASLHGPPALQRIFKVSMVHYIYNMAMKNPLTVHPLWKLSSPPGTALLALGD